MNCIVSSRDRELSIDHFKPQYCLCLQLDRELTYRDLPLIIEPHRLSHGTSDFIGGLVVRKLAMTNSVQR